MAMKPLTPTQFKAMRVTAGYNPTTLARKWNIMRCTIYNWEKGATPITIIVSCAMKYLVSQKTKK